MNNVNGWDERDYRLWSAVQTLRSFGLIAPDDQMISRNEVLSLLKTQAEERFLTDRRQSADAPTDRSHDISTYRYQCLACKFVGMYGEAKAHADKNVGHTCVPEGSVFKGLNDAPASATPETPSGMPDRNTQSLCTTLARAPSGASATPPVATGAREWLYKQGYVSDVDARPGKSAYGLGFKDLCDLLDAYAAHCSAAKDDEHDRHIEELHSALDDFKVPDRDNESLHTVEYRIALLGSRAERAESEAATLREKLEKIERIVTKNGESCFVCGDKLQRHLGDKTLLHRADCQLAALLPPKAEGGEQ